MSKLRESLLELSMVFFIFLTSTIGYAANDNTSELDKMLPKEKELEKFAEGIKNLAKNFATSLFIISTKENGVLYVVDPEERMEFNFQDKYKVTFKDLPERLKSIKKKSGEKILQSVVLSFSNDIRYEYIFHVAEAYSNAVYEVTGRIEKIYYQFAGECR